VAGVKRPVRPSRAIAAIATTDAGVQCQGLMRHPTRVATRYSPADQLDALVWQDLCALLAHPAWIGYALERAHGGHWLPQELQARKETLRHA
jgi:hypothetical protein